MTAWIITALLLAGCAPSYHAARDGDVAHPRVILDCYYNNEWKKDAAGNRWRYHYVWSDTLDSGFSRLGNIIEQQGGVPDTLCRKPSRSALARGDIYIIVDPDTPKETDAPAFLDESADSTIVDWVADGGILLLFGNDRGNAEFEHFNGLASRFGIEFRDTTRNRVIGKAYETGTFSSFPDHPMFHNIRKIYLKEISTLIVRPPARSLLVDGPDVIIAVAEYGNGLVFGVGDPWFYNEYMDHRRLPEGYDNDRTAANLIHWLFERIGRHPHSDHLNGPNG